MLNLENLRQFVAFADCGTLAAAAKKCHISQPTITRTMQVIEEDFGVPLFERKKNRISFNDTGLLAVTHARTVLAAADSAEQVVKAFDRAKRTIRIEACAPAPLWTLIPSLSGKYPSMTLTSELVSDSDRIIEHISDNACEIGISLKKPEDESISWVKYGEEKLSICLPANHELVKSNKTAVTFDDIDGFNCLLRSEIGFWTELVCRKMPASRFLIQADDFAMEELTQNTDMPFFVTNYSDQSRISDRKIILPITDTDSMVEYYLISRQKKYTNFKVPSRLLL